jgi:hypothetical protein
VPLRIAAKMREPAEQEYFTEHVAPLLGDGVEYVGEVGGADKLELLANATCLLNPIRWPEPFGMVMIEALACGTPVVATPCGSAPELITDGVTGFLRSGLDDLATAVRDAEQLDRNRCRKEAAERFSTERMVGEHLALYERVIRAHRREPRSRIDRQQFARRVVPTAVPSSPRREPALAGGHVSRTALAHDRHVGLPVVGNGVLRDVRHVAT